MSPADVTHLLLTRFNVQVAYSSPEDRLREDWLRARLAPFEAVCLPSIAHQRAADVRWLVLCDAQSPPWFKQRLASYSPLLAAVYLDGPYSQSALQDAIVRTSPVDTPWLVTTRLDSDDALAADHLARVRARAASPRAGSPRAGSPRERWLDFPVGLQLHQGGLYLSVWRSNPFVSLVERVDDPRQVRTALSRAHNRIVGVEPVETVWGPPAWLQSIHEANASSSLIGVPRLLARPHPQFAHVRPEGRGSWRSSAGAFAGAAARRLRPM